MQHRNHKCLFGTPRTRTQQPVQWGELKSAGAVATLHSWDAWLMPPPPPACCRLLQRRAGYEIPRNDDLFKNLAAWSCRMLLLVGFYKDLCSQWREPFTKFRWQLYCRSSIMFQGCCSFSVRAATGCSACSGAAWIWMVFISHLKQETRHKLILSLYLYIVQDAIPRYSADDSLLTGTVQ